MKAGLLLLFVTLSTAFNASYYRNSKEIVPNQGYIVYWNVEGDEIRLALRAKTTGWVGFGIAEQTSGSMPGADILVGSVSADGRTNIMDLHAMAKEYPIQDDCNQWTLIGGEEQNGFTTIEARRKIDTNDVQDRPFLASTRVICAWGAQDPLAYHGTGNRITDVIQFWGQAETLPTGSNWMRYINQNYTIPTVRTTYKEVYLPVNLTSDVSVVAMEVVVGSSYVHHFLAYGSEKVNLNTSSDISWTLLWGWAPGMDHFVLPEGTGFKFGPTGYRSVRMQIHYDNKDGAVGVIDNSGVKMYYETTLRPIEAAVMEMGDPGVRNSNPIPAGSSTIEFEYDCPSVCTNRFPGPLTVFGHTLHMHQVGNQMWGVQWRNGTIVRETNRIDFWDFAFQQLTPVSFTIMPGDRISTHCVYNQDPSVATTFGPGSDQEMCIQFFYYYPKVPASTYCGFHLARGVPVTQNVTICGTEQVQQSNPTVLDPVGGRTIVFGSQNPGTFVCPSTASSASASSSASSASSGSASSASSSASASASGSASASASATSTLSSSNGSSRVSSTVFADPESSASVLSIMFAMVLALIL